MALFADRARQVDARFVLDGRTGPVVARLVARLDGMPLAIELAAARVEALGVTGLLDRLDDRFGLLTAGDRLAPARQRSLAAAVEWSYRLLGEEERRVFRAVSVFPGPFTLEAAEAVAGARCRGGGAAAGGLLAAGAAAGRTRWPVPVCDAGDAARLRGRAAGRRPGSRTRPPPRWPGGRWRWPRQAAAGLQTVEGEAAAVRWLDAEDATMAQVLAWAMDHDAGVALRVAVALAPWWFLRGRLAGQYPLLRQVAGRAVPGSDGWCAAQFWLGRLAGVSGDAAASLGHLTALRDAAAERGPSRVLADGLAHRASALSATGRYAEAAGEARRALAMARELRYPAAEAVALANLCDAALDAGVFGLLVIGGSAGAFFAPPFTGLDTLPALGVVLLSLGVLLEDSLVVAIAVAVGIAGVTLEIALGAAAIHGLRTIF